jgi:hypothetical protein
MMPLPAKTGFIEFKKDGVPVKLKKHQRLNGNQRAID